MSIDLDTHFVSNDYSPSIIREGIFGATFYRNKEPLYLRMELLTKENAESWDQYKTMSQYMANNNYRGVLSTLLLWAGGDNCPKYENIAEVTGFTEEEYENFIKKAVVLKEKTQNKISTVIQANSVGINFMSTCVTADSKYIVYITKNDQFSIPNHKIELTLKNFIESYSDILISVGSNFSEEKSFQNRGISRNPYWVFEEKYAGLSMLLHGFAGAVADKYFPEKKMMLVQPVGSMQTIINKHLLPGDGYVLDRENKKLDLTRLEVSKEDPEGKMNFINISAVTRIYNQVIIEEVKRTTVGEQFGRRTPKQVCFDQFVCTYLQIIK